MNSYGVIRTSLRSGEQFLGPASEPTHPAYHMVPKKGKTPVKGQALDRGLASLEVISCQGLIRTVDAKNWMSPATVASATKKRFIPSSSIRRAAFHLTCGPFVPSKMTAL